MDIAAGTITIVKSSYTLYDICKSIVKEFRNSGQTLRDREEAVTQIRAVIGEIEGACRLDATDSDADADPKEKALREKIQNKLSSWRGELDGLDAEIKKLLPQNGKRQTISSSFHIVRGQAASKETFGKLEKSILDHVTLLLPLLDRYHWYRSQKAWQQTQDDIKEALDFIKGCVRFPRLSIQDASTVEGINHLKRQDPNDANIEGLADAEAGSSTNLERISSYSMNERPLEVIQQFLTKIASEQDQLYRLIRQIVASTDACIDGSGSQSDSTTWVDSESSTSHPAKSDKGSNKQSEIIRDWSFSLDPVSPDFPKVSRSPGPSSNGSSLRCPGSIRRQASTLSPPSLSPETSGDSPKTGDAGDCGAGNGDSEQSPKEDMQTAGNKDKGKELLELIAKGTDEEVQNSLQGNPSLEERDLKGKTPLLLAASEGKSDRVQNLVSHGADLHAVDQNQATALHIAIKYGQWPIVFRLLEINKNSPQSPTSNGSARGVDAVDSIGRTPLHYCTFYLHAEGQMKEVAQELIAFEADVNALDKSKKPPVYYAMKNGKYTIVKLLLQHKANIDNFDLPQNMGSEIRGLLEDYKREQTSSNLKNGETSVLTPSRTA